MSATTTLGAPAISLRDNRRAVPDAGSRSSSSRGNFSGSKRGNFTPRNGQKEKKEPKTLFQKYFKSVGPRTYAAQVKEAGNGNHFLVITEGKRDQKTNELKKLALFVFSEDFEEFKLLLRDTFKFIADHPMSPEMLKKRDAYWKKKDGGANKRA